MSTLFIEDIELGMERGLSRIVTDAEIEAFAVASGDRNPIHFDEDHAKETIFKHGSRQETDRPRLCLPGRRHSRSFWRSGSVGALSRGIGSW